MQAQQQRIGHANQTRCNGCQDGYYPAPPSIDILSCSEEEYWNWIDTEYRKGNKRKCERYDTPAYFPDACPRKVAGWMDKLRTANVGERYLTANKYWLSRKVKNPEAWRVVAQYLSDLEQNLLEGRSLILHGPYGTGKTTLAVCILQEVLALGKTGLMVKGESLWDEKFLKEAGGEWDKWEKAMRQADLLVLDGIEQDFKESVRAKVQAIIGERYDRRRAIILTTNAKIEDLKANLAPRTYDRLVEMCGGQTLIVAGESLRGKAG